MLTCSALYWQLQPATVYMPYQSILFHQPDCYLVTIYAWYQSAVHSQWVLYIFYMLVENPSCLGWIAWYIGVTISVREGMSLPHMPVETGYNAVCNTHVALIVLQ